LEKSHNIFPLSFVIASTNIAIVTDDGDDGDDSDTSSSSTNSSGSSSSSCSSSTITTFVNNNDVDNGEYIGIISFRMIWKI
jgi:hypothetical protein